MDVDLLTPDCCWPFLGAELEEVGGGVCSLGALGAVGGWPKMLTASIDGVIPVLSARESLLC